MDFINVSFSCQTVYFLVALSSADVFTPSPVLGPHSNTTSGPEDSLHIQGQSLSEPHVSISPRKSKSVGKEYGLRAVTADERLRDDIQTTYVVSRPCHVTQTM